MKYSEFGTQDLQVVTGGESLTGGALLLLEGMGLIKLDIVHNFGALHLSSPVPFAAEEYSLYLQPHSCSQP